MLEAVSSMLGVAMAASMSLIVASGQPVEAGDVSLCALLQHPEKYNSQEVTMSVGYRAGFEWQELVCAPCNTKQKIWADFDFNVKGAGKLGKFTSRFDTLYRVRVRGIFRSGPSHYGHLNGYDYLFIISEVFSAKRLWQITPSQPNVPAAIEARACQR